MNELLWNDYLSLQSGIDVETECGDRTSKASEPGPPILVIGPGGMGEIHDARNRFGSNITVLTLNPREAGRLDGVPVHVGDIHDMPFRNKQFTYVLAYNVLEHALSPYIALMECRRVVNGFLEMIVPKLDNSPYHLSCLTADHWMKLFVMTGFWPTFYDIGVYFKLVGQSIPLTSPHDDVFEKVCARHT